MLSFNPEKLYRATLTEKRKVLLFFSGKKTIQTFNGFIEVITLLLAQ